jgi:hypothetical protein
VRVTSVRRQATSDGAELLVSAKLTCSVVGFLRNPLPVSEKPAYTGGQGKLDLPLQFEIEGARSVVNVELSGEQTEVRDHRIPIEASRQRGWGRVSIPADSNPADDAFYFVFDQPPEQRAIVVADDPQAARPLELMAGISPDDSTKCSAEVLSLEQLSAAAWDQLSLVLWQTALPTGTAAELLEAFVDRGGQVIFFPPREPGGAELFGLRWQTWVEDERLPVETWRGDADLLARTLSGAALPVGQLEIHRHCTLSGEFTLLASLRGGAPLVARVPTDRGGVYFWTTTPSTRDSSLATDGVVLYAFIQRATAAGAAVLGKTRQLDAGNPAGESPADWQRVSTAADVLSTEAAYHSGVYSTVGGSVRDPQPVSEKPAYSRLLAVNRPQAEDDSRVLADSRVAELFRGLDFRRVDAEAGAGDSLIQEIWRMFLLSMLVALVLEAVLCLPKLSRARAAA